MRKRDIACGSHLSDLYAPRHCRGRFRPYDGSALPPNTIMRQHTA
ncbi:hypothetical protein ACCQ03_20260 [Xanthomonas sp. NCPPB 3569]|nr:hypothetical protein [Xanthomonas phaseoli]